MKTFALAVHEPCVGGLRDGPAGAAEVAGMWLTTADETQKLAAQPDVQPLGAAVGDEAVIIDTSKRFQKMQGFGASITDASAQLLERPARGQAQGDHGRAVRPQGDGLGMSFTRLTVGASDFSPDHYSYDDTPGNVPDPELKHFTDRLCAQVRAAANSRGAGDQSRPLGDDQPVERAGVDEDQQEPDHRASSSPNIIPPSPTISRGRSRNSAAKACR